MGEAIWLSSTSRQNLAGTNPKKFHREPNTSSILISVQARQGKTYPENQTCLFSRARGVVHGLAASIVLFL
jgi:hypothetical protein